MLYSKFALMGDVTTSVPVGIAQVGCTVTEAPGARGFELTIIGPETLLTVVHPLELVTLQ
jgi:hypothetical protein